MYKIYLIVFLLSLFGAPLAVTAQNRFGAGLTVGVNASQIDGDERLGYHKPGLNAGVRGVVRITEKIDVSTEIAYSQRGSQSRLIVDENAPYFKIKLNYLEVPVLFNYKDWKTTGVGEVIEGDGEEVIEDTYYRVHFHVGGSFSRLINANIDNIAASNVSQYVANIEKFEPNNYNWIVGASFFLKKHLAVTVRFNQTIGWNFHATKWGINANNLRNRHLTFGLLYML